MGEQIMTTQNEIYAALDAEDDPLEFVISRQRLRRAVTMEDAVQAGNSVLLNEQAMLLRECRAALDDLVKKKPGIEALLCGSTTIGNLRVSLGAHRPQGVMGSATAQERAE